MSSLLICALATALPSTPVAGDPIKFLHSPIVHGDQLVFNHAGDLWTSDLSGGIARRLTTFPANETSPVFSPDGQWIAFTGFYDGAPEVYVIPSEGGQPQRVTYEGVGSKPLYWKDNNTIAVSSNGQSTWGFMSPLQFVPRTGGAVSTSAVQEIANGSLLADGTLVYNRRNSYNFNWRRYRGGTQGVVSFYDLKQNKYWELSHGREQNYWPMAVGSDVYFISDRELGTLNFYKTDAKGAKPKQLTFFDDMDIKTPSTDGKTIVFERGSVLYAYDIATGKTREIAPRVLGDINPVRPILKKVAGNISAFSLSPSGARVAVEARGEIFTVPAKGGDTRNLSDSSGVRERFPAWSPDGQKIAYVTDKSGEYEIHVMGQRGGDDKTVTTGNLKIQGLDWMPDNKTLMVSTFDLKLILVDTETKKQTLVRQSNLGIGSVDVSAGGEYIAIVDTMENLFSALFIYDVKTGKTTQVTDGYYTIGSAAWDRGGKYLYVSSRRDYPFSPSSTETDMGIGPGDRVYMIPLTKDMTNPLAPREEDEPVAAKADAKKEEPKKPEAPKGMKIDFDGMEKRMIALPWPVGQVGSLIGDENGVYALINGGLASFSLMTRQPATILAPGTFQALTFNDKRNKIAFLSGGNVCVSDVRPEINPAQAAINTSEVEMIVDPRAEWKQIITDAWRWYRDKFYDANMVGVDWNMIKKRYDAMVPFCTNRNDVNTVLGLMIGEVGTGHAYVGGGDGYPISAPSYNMGMLGCDYAVVDGKIKFAKIFSGDGRDRTNRGPLTEPGLNIQEGMFLLAINGNKVDAANPPGKFLVNKATKNVILTIADNAAGAGSRKVTVRAAADDGGLRYDDYVSSRRELVSKLSGGKIGYFHVPDTAVDGIIGFQKGYYANSGKEAVIVDERFNGGGFIPTFFQERLDRRLQAAFKQRNGIDVMFPTQSILAPTCLLINEYAGSGGDLFPWFYKKNNQGKLIGKRTWGGLVGITGNLPLVDGGGVTVPEFGLYDPETGKWIAENTGIDPDIEVDARPDLIAAGRDPQIEKAVETLLAEIKKGRKPIKVPAFPDIRKKG